MMHPSVFWLALIRKWERQGVITRQEGWYLRLFETMEDFLRRRR